MPPTPKDRKPEETPEREATDRSLADERGKTDREMEPRRAVVERAADAAQARTRDDADQQLRDERERTDRLLPADGPDLGAARAAADRVVQAEREQLDRDLVVERKGHLRALRELLAAERESTDLQLLTERLDADADVNAHVDVLGVVSHDLRTLVAGVALEAGRLQRAEPGEVRGEILRGAGARLARYAARMNRLIEDLLDTASIEAGKLAVAPREADAREALLQVQEAFRDAPPAGVEVQVATPEAPVPALIDEDRVLQVLANLVSNAVKFTPAPGRICLTVEPHEGGARFSVSDTGHGIPADKLDDVFARGWQVAPGRSRGLGLGLFIARAIVEAHGGRIWVTSGPGGSTFYFTVPGPRR